MHICLFLAWKWLNNTIEFLIHIIVYNLIHIIHKIFNTFISMINNTISISKISNTKKGTIQLAGIWYSHVVFTQSRPFMHMLADCQIQIRFGVESKTDVAGWLMWRCAYWHWLPSLSCLMYLLSSRFWVRLRLELQKRIIVAH